MLHLKVLHREFVGILHLSKLQKLHMLMVSNGNLFSFLLFKHFVVIFTL